MLKGVFLLSSVAVGKRKTMYPLIQEETNSVTNLQPSVEENRGAGVTSCFFLSLTIIFSSLSLSFVAFSNFQPSETHYLLILNLCCSETLQRLATIRSRIRPSMRFLPLMEFFPEFFPSPSQPFRGWSRPYRHEVCS